MLNIINPISQTGDTVRNISQPVQGHRVRKKLHSNNATWCQPQDSTQQESGTNILNLRSQDSLQVETQQVSNTNILNLRHTLLWLMV